MCLFLFYIFFVSRFFFSVERQEGNEAKMESGNDRKGKERRNEKEGKIRAEKGKTGKVFRFFFVFFFVLVFMVHVLVFFCFFLGVVFCFFYLCWKTRRKSGQNAKQE